MRIGALVAVLAVIWLAQAMRPRWRLVTGLAGFLIEVVRLNLFSGGMRDASSLVGMTLLLFALMKRPGVQRPPGGDHAGHALAVLTRGGDRLGGCP